MSKRLVFDPSDPPKGFNPGGYSGIQLQNFTREHPADKAAILPWGYIHQPIGMREFLSTQTEVHARRFGLISEGKTHLLIRYYGGDHPEYGRPGPVRMGLIAKRQAKVVWLQIGMAKAFTEEHRSKMAHWWFETVRKFGMDRMPAFIDHCLGARGAYESGALPNVPWWPTIDQIRSFKELTDQLPNRPSPVDQKVQRLADDAPAIHQRIIGKLPNLVTKQLRLVDAYVDALLDH